ncbi:hypothetical protein AURDEDRAFT_167205 [Auricularia subglabra TFB-10046 SS5]|nr:hypothetical protein AURDEDRAFT_167205 [Auricularia subglabra TFB-10046 SS5]
MLALRVLSLSLLAIGSALAQVSSAELAPLLDSLTNAPASALGPRVPLMTDDKTVAPLYSVQVHAPTVVPARGSSCTVTLLRHEFGVGSYNAPAVVRYQPPQDAPCGPVGKWAAVTMNLTVYAIGTQYDRLTEIYLGHVEIWRSSSAEPTKTGTIWTTIKDVTHYTALFAKPNDLMMDFSNIIDESILLDAPFEVTISATFHAPNPSYPTPRTADLILPLSNRSPTFPNFFTISDDAGATTGIQLPDNTVQALVEVYCSGNSAEEFWYSNTPDEFVPYFPDTVTPKGPFREVQVLVDGLLAGVVWPFPVIYTGGVTPSNWRPLTAYGTYDQPHYVVDITPLLPVLLSGNNSAHNITLRVQGQGLTPPSINSNWFVSGSVHATLGRGRTTGRLLKHDAGSLKLKTAGGASAGNETVWTKVAATRNMHVESVINVGGRTRRVVAKQNLSFENTARYADEGWVQWVEQMTKGTTSSSQDGITYLRDVFEYPISMFSNYSLYTQQFGGYGSRINQTHTRAFSSPFEPYSLVHSVQHAQGWINMDDWPGLRHAINGTGATDMTFAFTDAHAQTYFRSTAAKNDGWVRDAVWGSLASRLPALPRWQISGPNGGAGFRIRREVV